MLLLLSMINDFSSLAGTCKSSEAASISLPSQLKKEMAVTRERYVWRTDLSASAPHWKGWYTGLSQLFLDVPAPKILMLAGSDRLDKTLTIGQMQGKFQMSLLPQVSSLLGNFGHSETLSLVSRP